MRTTMNFIFTIFFMLSFSNAIWAQQEDCKVLLEDISGEYVGDCKKGLAHGEGVAKGKDVYSGKFKKGLPHGEGKYTWESGQYYVGSFKNGQKSGHGKYKLADGTIMKEGIWKDDEFFKEQDIPDYKIGMRRNIINASIRNLGGESDRIEIVLVRDGRESTINVHDLMIVASGGVQRKTNSSIVYEDMVYPFKCNVKFKAPGRMSSTTVTGMGSNEKMTTDITQMPEVAVEFEILEKGNWEVRIKY